MLGHLKKPLDSESKRELLQSIDDYRRPRPLVVPLTLLRHHVRLHGVDYLAGQTYLEPHPRELMLAQPCRSNGESTGAGLRALRACLIPESSLGRSVGRTSPCPSFVGRAGRGTEADDDLAAVEEPLEVRLHGKPFAVIMRTPGDDRALAAGFLLSEGVVRTADDIGAVEHCRHPDRPDGHNVVDVYLLGDAGARARRDCWPSAASADQLLLRHLRPRDDRLARDGRVAAAARRGR